jgi:mono/diheme cytochrome c family protein
MRRLAVLPLLVVAALAVGCGEEGVEVAQDDPTRAGAESFARNCAGCHTLTVAGTQGSASNVATREYKDGPNFDQRKESVEDVLYAIENGGFSSGPMPQNIVTGEEARQVAEFVARYSGGGTSGGTGTTGG